MNKFDNLFDTHKILRICVYVVEFFVLLAMQQTPGLVPEIFGGRPTLIIALFFAVSLLEGNYLSLFFGAITGLVLDISMSSYIGLQVVIMGILGFLIGKIRRKIFRVNIWIFMALCLLFEPILIFFRFYMSYVIKGLENADIAFYNHILPGIIYTVILSPIIYLFNRPVWFFVRKRDGD